MAPAASSRITIAYGARSGHHVAVEQQQCGDQSGPCVLMASKVLNVGTCGSE